MRLKLSRSQTSTATGPPRRAISASMCSCSPRRLRRPVSGSCSARWRICASWLADATALIAWLAKARSAWRCSRRGQQAVVGLVRPDHPGEPALAVAQRHEQPVVVPGARAAAVAAARVDGRGRLARGAAARRLLGLSSTTPSGSSAGSSSAAYSSRAARRAPRARRRPGRRPRPGRAASSPESMKTQTFSKPSASWTPTQTASSISSTVPRSLRWVETRSRCSTAARWRVAAAACWASSSASAACEAAAPSWSSCSSVGRRPSSGSSTDEDPEHLARGRAQRHEQRVLGVPGVRALERAHLRHVGEQAVLAPVEGVVLDEVRAAALEARVEQRRPVLPAGRLAEQDAARLVGAVHDDGLEVVPRRAVQVDDGRPEAEAASGGPGDLLQDRSQLVGRARAWARVGGAIHHPPPSAAARRT